jgi:hypothetical protein
MSTDATHESRSSSEWRLILLGLLDTQDAPRVCTTQDVAQLLRRVRPRATADTLHSAIEGLVFAGALQKVSRGLFLNRRVRPAAESAEAASYIRTGAVVSLETVLGECGFLNNPAAIITAVLPQCPGKVPNVGHVKSSGGLSFRFHALPQRFFASSEDEELLLYQAGRHCAMAKPEAAVLHWLHLWRSPRSSMSTPPQDVDFSVFDEELLERLAFEWELAGALRVWRDQVLLTGDIQEPSAVKNSVSEQQRLRGQDVRARMLARNQVKKF